MKNAAVSRQIPLLERFANVAVPESGDTVAAKRKALELTRGLLEKANRSPAHGITIRGGDVRQLVLFDSPDEVANFVWDEKTIIEFHEKMIFDALSSLKDSRLSVEHFKQILAWIGEPLHTLGGRYDPQPFTFAACCAVAGIGPEGTERLQDMLLSDIIPKHLKEPRNEAQTNKGLAQRDV